MPIARYFESTREAGLLRYSYGEGDLYAYTSDDLSSLPTKPTHLAIVMEYASASELFERMCTAGSNVQGLQTTATFDPITDKFIVNTPNDGAIKWRIGNAAVHGKFATVFAMLLLPTHDIKGVADMGIDAFIVPIRDMKTHETLPGIEIHDCGHKVGLNGVDNGALRFHSVRIPRDNLLNRFGDVSRDGKYSSTLPSIASDLLLH